MGAALFWMFKSPVTVVPQIEFAVALAPRTTPAGSTVPGVGVCDSEGCKPRP